MNIEKIRNLYLNEKYSVKEIAGKLNISFWNVYNLMEKNNISRRNCAEAQYLAYDRYKPKFSMKKRINPKEKKLKIAGLMLYWAEGAKNGCTLDFANSEPQMIKIFLRFLREICGVAESRIRIYLYAFSDQNIYELIRYWSKITQVPISNFTKPYIRKVKPELKDRRMPLG